MKTIKSTHFLRHIIFLCLILSASLKGNAVLIAVSSSVNGRWNNWENAYGVGVYGNYSGFSISYASSNIWDYYFCFKIDNYHEPSKAEIKRHYKEKEWYIYSGTVEYYVTDDHPTIESVIRAYGCRLLSPNGSTHRVKRIAKAQIKIEPYKKRPRVYNIYFDGVGYAIDLLDNKWD